MDLARLNSLGDKEQVDQSWIDITDIDWLESLENNLKAMLELSLDQDQLELFKYYLKEAEKEFKLVAEDEGYYKIPKYELYKIKRIHDLLIDVAAKYSDDKELKKLCLDVCRCIHELIRTQESKGEYKPVKYYQGNNKLYSELNMLTDIARKVPNRGMRKEELRAKITPRVIADFLTENYKLKNRLIEELAKRLKEGRL
ncbi:hypothetical protein CW711_01295 [Candidatus Bathyarchaeota archaeon]|nr:MAG: hypothetical protein CW711_01295 [Candidatus Bathyarchaeota archaeon]